MSIQPYQPMTQAVDYQNAAVHRLGEWAQSASAAYKVAESLVQTAFVPQAFRGKPMEATAAILAGTEVGLSPMSALRAFDIIQGQAAPRAITLRAIVQSYGHQMVLVESTATRCRMKGLRRGDTEWQNVTWTIDRARDLGLTGKDNWKKQPAAMLTARATSELARLIAADAILGIGYTVEEIADGGTVEQVVAEQTVDATPTGTRRMSRPRPTANDDGADAPDEPDTDAPPVVVESEPVRTSTSAPSSPSDAQRGLMFASFKDAGFTTDARTAEGRQARLDYIANVIGREVESSNDLTSDEMSLVIDSLKAAAEAAADPWAGDQP